MTGGESFRISRSSANGPDRYGALETLLFDRRFHSVTFSTSGGTLPFPGGVTVLTHSTGFSLYDILNVPNTATSAEIKTAFRLLALKHHPDKHHNSIESTATFKTIHNAYTVLSNRDSRERYDRVLGAARSSTAAAGRDTSERPTLQILPDSAPTATVSLLLDHLNFVLWDIEELLMSSKRNTQATHLRSANEHLTMMLTFIDRWILQPAGVSDHFFQARGLKPPAQIGGTSTLPYQNAHGGHRPYTDVTDYFYNVRRRVDELFRKARLIDFSSQLAGTSVTLTDCILEAHNYCVHYLGWMKRGGEESEKEGDGIPPFRHSQPAFERTH